MNQQVMMRKLMKMKEEMEQTQEEINTTEFNASAGGIVTVYAYGTKEISRVVISEDFEIESKDDLDMLSDMIVAASSELYKKIDKETEERLAKYKSLLGGFGF